MACRGCLKLGSWFADGFDAMCHVPGQLRDPRGGLAPSRQPEGLPETALFNTALGEVVLLLKLERHGSTHKPPMLTTHAGSGS